MLKLPSPYAALAFGAMLCAGGPSTAGEVNYPTQTVRLISAFAAGGGNDLMARELAQKFGEEFKKTFIVEDKVGGNGDIATDYVARAPANGETLLVTTNATVVINPQLFKDVIQFDPVKDFAPVSLLARQPFVLVVNNDLPVKTVGELIDYARAHPGKLNFGSSGAGGGAHLSGEMLKTLMKLSMTHVPYKGVAPALTGCHRRSYRLHVCIDYHGKAACRRRAVARARRHQQNPQPGDAEPSGDGRIAGSRKLRGRSLVWPFGAGEDRPCDRQQALSSHTSCLSGSGTQGSL